ncbi:unnamed protein product [Pylaiella littoralis]
MEKSWRQAREKAAPQGARHADPFADLLSFTTAPKQSSEAAPAVVSSRRPAGASDSQPIPASPAWGEVAPIMTSEGPLGAEKGKSQESRRKRDIFLNQMSDFLEGIESSTPAEVVPPEPFVSFSESSTSLPITESYTAATFPPPAASGPSTSIFPESSKQFASSSLMSDDLFGDPFVRQEPYTPSTKPPGRLQGMMLGTSSNISHPRGSLFDDDDVGVEDVSAEQQEPLRTLPQSTVASDSGSMQRVTPRPLPLSTPSHDTRNSPSQGRPRSTSKPTRGLDLGEVRRRTSLLSGRSAAPPPPVSAPTRRTAAAPRPATASSYLGADWGRQGAPASSTDEVPSHPLHASATASGGGSGGNYFNEEFLRKREQGGCTGTRGVEQGGQGGNNLMDSTGNFFNTARNGARTLLQDAKAGVDAVGANWQSSREETGQQRFNRTDRPSRGLRHKENEGEGEFDVTFGEGRLGFTLCREAAGPRKGKGVVCKVHTGSTAHTLGVAVGDVAVGVNKHRYDTYDEIMEVLPKLPRPALITFARRAAGQPIEGSMAAASWRQSTPSSTTSEGGGGNPLVWLAKLNPFDKRRRDEEDERRVERRSSADFRVPPSQEYGLPGEVFARGLRGGVFSWSYYGTSDGIEANTRDTYTEHVMRCQWGRTGETMQSWMVARRYREFVALDLDLRDAYPDRREALPRLPPKEFFKLAPDVVERRTRGLEMYLTTIIRRFPDMLESSHLDRFLTISERLSVMQATTAPGSNSQTLYRNLGANGSSSNVFAASEPFADKSSSPVGTNYILHLMTSEEAWQLSTTRNSSPVDVAFCEDLVLELSDYVSRIPPEAHLLSDEMLYALVARCQKAWPGLKAAAGKMVSEDACKTLLPRIVQCDEEMERAFEKLGALLTSRGYIRDTS